MLFDGKKSRNASCSCDVLSSSRNRERYGRISSNEYLCWSRKWQMILLVHVHWAVSTKLLPYAVPVVFLPASWISKLKNFGGSVDAIWCKCRTQPPRTSFKLSQQALLSVSILLSILLVCHHFGSFSSSTSPNVLLLNKAYISALIVYRIFPLSLIMIGLGARQCCY